MEVLIEEEALPRKSLSYYHTRDTRNTLFKVCDLGKSNLIISYTWLHKHNPEIDWETRKVGMMRCLQECNVSGRRQKGIKRRKRGVGEEKSTKT